MNGVSVSALSITAIKGTRIREVPEIELLDAGARGDRRFYVIDERGQMRNGKQLGALQQVVSSFDEHSGVLTLSLPDGTVVADEVSLGEEIETRFFSRPRTDRLLVGPWASELSSFVGVPLRIVATDGGTDRGAAGRASLVSRASLERLASVGELDSVDWRRFRMLIEADGLDAHAEDAWVGRDVRIGAAAVIRWGGHVGRCLVTGRNPDTGTSDVDTLEVLGWYRRELDSTEPLPFGIYGSVVTPGVVRVGDPIALLEP